MSNQSATQQERARSNESHYRLSYYNALVPEPDRFKLSDLQPSPKSKMPLDQQQRVYDEMRKNPKAGYALFGPSG